MIMVLIHSPLTGPDAWQPVRDALITRGQEAVAAVLSDNGAPPYWEQHAQSAARQLASWDPTRLILITHSGAGPLLPAIRDALGTAPAGYMFVDAGLPASGLSRLGMMEHEDLVFANTLRDHLRAGLRFPAWSNANLAALVPDDVRRAALVAGLRPRGADFFEEPLPDSLNWPDAPVGYLQFSPAYDVPATQARDAGYLVRTIPGGHFHMLVEPDAVAEMLLDIWRSMRP